MTRGSELSDESKQALKEVVVYASGMLFCSACAPAGMPADEVEDAVNAQNPTGIASRWKVADEPFADGAPNPPPCNDGPLKTHWLLSC